MNVYSCAVHVHRKDDLELLKRFHQVLITRGVRNYADWNTSHYPGCRSKPEHYCLFISDQMWFFNHNTTAPICYSLTRYNFDNLAELISHWWHKTYGNKQQDDPIPVTTITVKHEPVYIARADRYEATGISLEDAVRNLLYKIKQSKTRKS